MRQNNSCLNDYQEQIVQFAGLSGSQRPSSEPLKWLDTPLTLPRKLANATFP
jgi:hypothetical protein